MEYRRMRVRAGVWGTSWSLHSHMSQSSATPAAGNSSTLTASSIQQPAARSAYDTRPIGWWLRFELRMSLLVRRVYFSATATPDRANNAVGAKSVASNYDNQRWFCCYWGAPLPLPLSNSETYNAPHTKCSNLLQSFEHLSILPFAEICALSICSINWKHY